MKAISVSQLLVEHPLFFENLKLSWTKPCAEHAGRFSLLRKLSYLASTIRKWNKNSFGNQDGRLLQIQSRL
jgi:hypothetical protein